MTFSSKTALFLLLFGCVKAPVSSAPEAPAPITLQASTDGPTILSLDDYAITTGGLQSATLVAGQGPKLQSGDTAQMHYTGWLLDGSVFDSSYQRQQPLTVKVGAGQVIRGWDEGLVGMTAGEKRQLIIPPRMGYGSQDKGAIPANSTLVFEMSLVSFVPARRPPESMRETNATYTVRPSGLEVADIDGCSEKIVDGGDIYIEYTTWLLSEQRVASSYESSGPLKIRSGDPVVVRGLVEGTKEMPIGCTRNLKIPPHLGYGRTGSGAIPPYQTTIWQVERVEK